MKRAVILWCVLLLTYKVSLSQIPIDRYLRSKIGACYDRLGDAKKPLNSEFYIIDIKVDRNLKKIISTHFIRKVKSDTTILFSCIQEQLNTVEWKDALNYDRIIIPVFYIPLFDGGEMDEHPIKLQSGPTKFELSSYSQYVYPEIVVIAAKAVR